MENYEEQVITFMASAHGLQTDNLTEEQEAKLLKEFDACDEYQRDFRIFS